MGVVELFILAVGLSADAFAVALGKGLGMSRLDWRQAVLIAAFFGGFQALMPLAGWLIGEHLDSYIAQIEKWVAFGLLVFIGAKMIWDAFHEERGGAESPAISLRELLLLAIATSIDAFAAGVALALLDVNIGFAVALIGATTFALSLAGVAAGYQFGSRWSRPSTVIGGAILIIIGVKALF